MSTTGGGEEQMKLLNKTKIEKNREHYFSISSLEK